MLSFITNVIMCIVSVKYKVGNKLKRTSEKVHNAFNNIKDKNDGKAKEWNNAEKLGKVRYKFLMFLLRLISIIMSVIDTVVVFIITHFLLILLCLAVVLLILLVTLSMLGTDFSDLVDSKGDDNVENPTVSTSGYDNITAWTLDELQLRGGNLTNQEKNIYRLIMLFKQYESTSKSGMGIQFTMGQAVSESGFLFYTNTVDATSKNILQDTIDGHIEGNLGLFGGLFGTDLAGIQFGTDSYKSKIDTNLYTPAQADRNALQSKYGATLQGYDRSVDDLLIDVFVPYAVQRQIYAVDYYYSSDGDETYVTIAKQALERVGLEANSENLDILRQFACIRRSLVSTFEYAEPVYMFYAMLMKLAATDTGKVDMSKWSVGTDIKTEPQMRSMFLGSINKTETIESIADMAAFDDNKEYLTLNGKSIGCILWVYLKNRFGAEDWWQEQEDFFIGLYNNAVNDYNRQAQYMLIYNYGITRYMGVNNVITDITGKLTGISDWQAAEDEMLILHSDTFAFPLIDYRGTNNLDKFYSGCMFGYGYLDYNGASIYRFHKGMDISVWNVGVQQMSKTKIRIAAAAAGTVTAVGFDSSMGNYVKIEHNSGWVTVYMHLLETPLVKKGDKVNTETVIGYMGSSGMSTGCHLHWQIQRIEGSVTAFVDPRIVCKELSGIVQSCFNEPLLSSPAAFLEFYGRKWVGAEDVNSYKIYWSLT